MNIIVSDVDGVMLNWHDAFIFYMHEKNYDLRNQKNDIYDGAIDFERKFSINENVENFNMSFSFSRLAPLRDSVKYVKKLYEERGIQIICCTSCGTSSSTVKAREKNLLDVFGNAIFDIQFLNTKESKYLNLKQLKEKYDPICWIEDKKINAIHGHLCGYKTFFMNHSYNFQDELDDGIIRVNTWKEIYEEI